MRSDQALADKIDRLEADPAIPVGAVDLTVVDPDRLRHELDEVFRYFALVEGEVAQNALDVASMLPDLDDYDRRFLAVWSAHEVAHSAIFDAIRGRLGVPVDDRTSPSRPQRAFRALGALAHVPWFHDILKLVYLARGAMHERLTLDAYIRVGARLASWGELALVRSVTDPIRSQEARHLGYYRTAAGAHRRRLSPAQLWLARSISIHTYAPVGVNRQRRAQCGRVFTKIAGDEFQGLEPIAAIAEDLLGDGHRPLPCFVESAMRRCLASGT